MSRVGNFTSSQIYRLMADGRAKGSVGKPFETYVKEKIREIRTGRPINSHSSSRSTEWGNFMEGWVFEEKLGLEYSLVSKQRYKHPELAWSGMPDLITDEFVGDIKNPWTINSFCDLVDAMESPELLKRTSPEYYWQLVSNSILCQRDKVELFVHVPYQDELASIREATEMYQGDQNKVAFINWASDSELPYLLRDMFYHDLNHISFEIPQEDKDSLTDRVKLACDELKSYPIF